MKYTKYILNGDIPDSLKDFVKVDGESKEQSITVVNADEFRAHNAKIAEVEGRLKEQMGAYQNIMSALGVESVDKVSELMDEYKSLKTKLEAGELTTNEKVEDRIKTKTTEIAQQWNSKLEAETQKYKRLLEEKDRTIQNQSNFISDEKVKKKFSEIYHNKSHGFVPEAEPEIAEKFTREFKLDDNGQFVSRTDRINSDSLPYTVDNWLAEFKNNQSNHFYFKPNQGGGSTGGTINSGKPTVKPGGFAANPEFVKYL